MGVKKPSPEVVMASPAPVHINRSDLQNRKRRIVYLAGYFEPKAGVAPTVCNIPGVSSVTYTATGKLLLLLDAQYKDLSVVAALQLHTPADFEVVVSDVTLNDTTANSGKSSILLITTLSSTGAAAVPPASVPGALGNRIHVVISAVLGDKDLSSAN